MLFIERKYGKFLIGTSFLIFCFVIAGIIFTYTSYSLWSDFQDSTLSKIGIGTSLTGVFLGTFIAAWLINRDRTKNIEEQHVYKVDVLHNLDGIVLAVQRGLHEAMTKVDTADVIQKTVDYQIDEYKYWANLIRNVNTNSYIPSTIRIAMELFLREGIKPLTSVWTASKDKEFVKTTMLNRLDQFIDSDFVSKDNDKTVQHYLKNVKESRNLLVETIE